MKTSSSKRLSWRKNPCRSP